jgi:hypothetical protein
LKKLTDEAVSDHITFGGNSSRTFWALGIARLQGGSGSSVSIVPPAQSMDAAPPASPPALLSGGRRGPAGASRAGAQRHRETGRATTKVQPLSPACERIRGPARRVEAGRRPRAPPPRRRRGRASSSSAVLSLPPLSSSAPHHIHVLASLPLSSILHQIFRDIKHVIFLKMQHNHWNTSISIAISSNHHPQSTYENLFPIKRFSERCANRNLCELHWIRHRMRQIQKNSERGIHIQ